LKIIYTLEIIFTDITLPNHVKKKKKSYLGKHWDTQAWENLKLWYMVAQKSCKTSSNLF